MRENDGRKLDHLTLETIRFRAIQAVEAGQHPEDVAAAYGLHPKTVYGWIAKYRDGGPQALTWIFHGDGELPRGLPDGRFSVVFCSRAGS